MRNEYIKRGEFLPKKLLPIFNNPMGSYALYLGKSYAIHDINFNYGGIGLRTTRGCIRLRPQDIKTLYTLVPVGTRVLFINEPIKTTKDANGCQYIEIHYPLATKNNFNHNHHMIINHLKQRVYEILKHNPNINYKAVDQAILECSGIPINISSH